MSSSKRTFGSMPKTVPPGFFKAVRFPILALLNKQTGDHRLLSADGGSTRELPISIRSQMAATWGHDGAVPTGALFEVTFDPDATAEYGIVSGAGFLLDDDAGRQHFRYIATGAQRGNSVDLAEVSAKFVEDADTGQWWTEFTKWSLAATTGVGTPAFADAKAEVDWTPDELMAAIGDPMEELVASITPEEWLKTGKITVLMPKPEARDLDTELLAAYSAVDPIPHELFFREEADVLTKIVVTADNHVYGHLTGWELTHDGMPGVRAPRPRDGYASFNKPGVLTDKGIVPTGPIMAYGGHRKANGRDDLVDPYGGIENIWADVRITEGRLGPWISGIIRPGTKPETVFAARASRISGHWLGDRLKIIVSVGAEGFDVPGPEEDLILAAGDHYAFRTVGDELELVASLGAPDKPEETIPMTLTEGDIAAIAKAFAASQNQTTPPAESSADVDPDGLLMALLLDDEDDDDAGV